MATREVQSISDLDKLDTDKNNPAAFQHGNKKKQGEDKESSVCSNTSSEPTDEEIVDIVQKRDPVINLRNRLSTKAVSDANFNAVKLKRWSDYRASWNQHVVSRTGGSNQNLSKSEQVLATTQEESETPVPTTVLDLQKRNSIETNGDQQQIIVEHQTVLSDEFENAVKEQEMIRMDLVKLYQLL